MPALNNLRWEAFANHIATRSKTKISQADAYLRSGYKTKQRGAEVAGSRLLKKPEIKSRIAQITAPAVRKSGVTLEKVLFDAEQSRQLAMDIEQPSAAIAASTLQAKLVGLLRDRVEVGRPGEFYRCDTPDELLQHLRQKTAAESIDSLHEQRKVLEAMRMIIEDEIASRAQSTN